MKVLILSCSTGEGHNSAALALKEEFQKRKIRKKNDNISKDIKSANKGIKNAKNTIKKTEKVAKGSERQFVWI